MDSTSIALVGAAAICASAVNAAAGGGAFISFPALLGVGVPPVAANATNNVALLLGNLIAAGKLRADLNIDRTSFMKMLAVSLIGSFLGALLLLRTSNATFASLIPFLLLGATVVYVAGPRLTRIAADLRLTAPVSPAALGAQFAVALYGGFFGAAMGIVMLALLGVLGVNEPRRANALKNVLAAGINAVACVPCAIAHAVDWPAGIAMSLGSILGGYAGAHLVKSLPGRTLRMMVSIIAASMTLWFFWKAYS